MGLNDAWTTRGRTRAVLVLLAAVGLAAAVQAGLQYGPFEARPRPPLLHDPLDADLKKEPPHSNLRKFKAQWSLRDVEAEVPVIVRRLDGGTPETS